MCLPYPGAMTDLVMKFLAERASANPHITRAVLFGSRASGSATERSDYDVAIETNGMDHAAWSAWALRTKEDFPSLCGLELVWMNELTNVELRQKVEQEGKLIYGR